MGRRVERRDYMVGTGMLTDPERLAEIEQQKHHSELNARLPPKTTFKQVLMAPKVSGNKKRKRPVSSEKLRPTAAHPAQQVVGFGVDDEWGLEEKREKIVMKV